MENFNGKSRARFWWSFSSATIGLAVSASLCFADENQNASHETATILAAIIAVLSAISAVVSAVVANRSARAAMKSAYAVMISAERKSVGALVLPVTGIVNKKVDWARNFIDAVDTPLGVVLTILFSLSLGIGLNILLPRSDAPQATVPASSPATPASTAPVSAPPLPTAAAATPDHNEVAAMLARGRAYLSEGDVASARMLLRRAAERDDQQAALALAGTYDPAELTRIGIPRAQADLAKAREWYRKAAEFGSAEAALRLQQLPKTDRSFAPLRAMRQAEPGGTQMPGAGPGA